MSNLGSNCGRAGEWPNILNSSQWFTRDDGRTGPVAKNMALRRMEELEVEGVNRTTWQWSQSHGNHPTYDW